MNLPVPTCSRLSLRMAEDKTLRCGRLLGESTEVDLSRLFTNCRSPRAAEPSASRLLRNAGRQRHNAPCFIMLVTSFSLFVGTPACPQTPGTSPSPHLLSTVLPESVYDLTFVFPGLRFVTGVGTPACKCRPVTREPVKAAHTACVFMPTTEK